MTDSRGPSAEQIAAEDAQWDAVFDRHAAEMDALAKRLLARIKGKGYPRCRTCDHWNEFEAGAQEPGLGYLSGICEHAHIRTPHEGDSLNSETARWATSDESGIGFFWTSEDFGCVLHSEIAGKRHAPSERRLKIKCVSPAPD